MQHITEENFKDITPTTLLESVAYFDVEEIVLELTGAEDPDEAQDYAVALSDKLAVVGNNMPKDLFGKYLLLLKILRLYSLRRVSDVEKEKFFHEQILDLFRTDLVDVRQGTDFLFRGFFDAPDIIDALRGFCLRGLEKNQEVLGQQPLTEQVGTESREVKPNLQNWLKNYNESVHMNPETHRRSGFEQTNFILHSIEAQKLNKNDRDTLLKVIQFYDWLKFGSLRYNFELPGEIVKQEDDIFLEKPQDIIPKELLDELDEMRAVKAKASAPIVSQKFTLPDEINPAIAASAPPAVPGATKAAGGTAVGADNIERPDNQLISRSANQPISEPTSANRAAAPRPKGVNPVRSDLPEVGAGGYSRRASNGVNIQEILKRNYGESGSANQQSANQQGGSGGLRMGDGEGKISNFKLQIPNQNTVEKQKPDIDKKLEELKNRAGKNF